LSRWDKHSLSQLGLGKVKRDLSLSHGTSHIPTLEAFPCPETSSIPTMELVPVPLVPTCLTKWVYKLIFPKNLVNIVSILPFSISWFHTEISFITDICKVIHSRMQRFALTTRLIWTRLEKAYCCGWNGYVSNFNKNISFHDLVLYLSPEFWGRELLVFSDSQLTL